jgi:hypothetical protein
MTPAQEQADRLFARAVRGIGYCENCGTTERLECAHVLSRRHLAIRVDFRNAICLCHECHAHYTTRPKKWEARARELIGDATYDLLDWLRLNTDPARIDWPAEVERLKTDAPPYRIGYRPPSA